MPKIYYDVTVMDQSVIENLLATWLRDKCITENLEEAFQWREDKYNKKKARVIRITIEEVELC